MRTRRRRAPLPPGFGTVWATVALDLVGFGIVLPILPLYARRLHATTWQATLLVAAFSAASLVCSPLWGRLSDRVGRRPALLASLAGTALGSLLTGLAGGLPLLLLGRLVDGASGASVSVAQATVADLAAPAERPRLFGLLGAAFGLGFVAGPAIGALAALGGPRVPFLVAAGLAAVNAVVASRRLPETHPGGRQGQPAQPAQPVGDRGQPAGDREGPVRAPAPGPRRAFRRPGVVPLVVVSACTLAAFSAFESTFALFGHRHLGLGIGSSAATFAAVGLVIVGVQGGLVQPVVRRLGEVATLAAGLAADAAGLLLLAPARGWLVAGPALALLTVGQGLVQTTMASALAGRADEARRGEVLGVGQAAAGLGRVVGPVVGGALLGATASGTPYLLGAGLVAAALLVVGTGVRDPGVRNPADDVTVK